MENLVRISCSDCEMDCPCARSMCVLLEELAAGNSTLITESAQEWGRKQDKLRCLTLTEITLIWVILWWICQLLYRNST